MDLANKDLEEVEEGQVLRRAKISHHFPPNSPKPIPKHFELSSAEKRLAEETERPPMLSVYDAAQTTPEQCVSLASSKNPYNVYKLDIKHIGQIDTPDGWDHIRVLRDLAHLFDRANTLPGEEGHCGITGLKRPPGAQKLVLKSILSQLADLSRLALQSLPDE